MTHSAFIFFYNITQMNQIIKFSLSIFILHFINHSSSQVFPLSRSQALGLSISNCTQPVSNNQSTISLGNCNNYLYYMNIGIGSPPQNFTVLVDTGSNILWVPTMDAIPTGFNSTLSSTFQNTSSVQSIEYGDQSTVSGFMGFDMITILPQININGSVLFANSQGDMSSLQGVSGINGLGVPQPNIFDIAYQKGKIKTSTFSLSCGNTNQTSYLYYNDIPLQILNNTIYAPVTGNTRWQLQLIGFFAGDKELNSYGYSAVIDSGTSLFYLNQNLYSQFTSQYLQGCNNLGSVYLCKCNAINLPPLKFMFLGVQIQINPSSYVVNGINGFCFVYIATLSTLPNLIILGDVLFLQYTITFNKLESKIGFYGNQTESIYIFGLEQLTTAGFSMMGLIILFSILACILVWQTSEEPRQGLKQRLTQPKQKIEEGIKAEQKAGNLDTDRDQNSGWIQNNDL